MQNPQANVYDNSIPKPPKLEAAQVVINGSMYKLQCILGMEY